MGVLKSIRGVATTRRARAQSRIVLWVGRRAGGSGGIKIWCHCLYSGAAGAVICAACGEDVRVSPSCCVTRGEL